MKILYIVTAFPRNEQDVITPWLIETIKRLQNKGHSVTIFTSSYKGLEQREIFGIPVFRFRYFFSRWETLTHDEAVPERLKRGLFFKLLIIPYILFGCINSVYFACKYDFDIIHVHWPFPHIVFGFFMKMFTGKPLICTFYLAEIILLRKTFHFLTPFFKALLSFADITTVISSFTKHQLNQLLSVKNATIIPFGCTIPEVRTEPRTKTNEILFVGRLVERKGIEYLIKAFSKVISKYNSYTLRIVGDGPIKNSLLSLTKSLGLKSKVIFAGFVSKHELIESYKKAAAFVLPAIVDSKGDTEGLGVVLIEAINYGVPVIASNVGGIPDIVKDKITGILVPEKDSNALSEAMMNLLENKELRQKLTKNATEHIQKYFSWSTVVNKLDVLYSSFIINHPR